MSFGSSCVGSEANWSSDSQFGRDGWKRPAALKTYGVEGLVRAREKREPSPVDLATNVVRQSRCEKKTKKRRIWLFLDSWLMAEGGGR